MKQRTGFFMAGVVILIALAAATTVVAQQKGQYLPGSSGLNSGIQAPPGFTYANIFTYYSADTLKGPNGNTIPTQGNLSMFVDQNIFVYATKYKLLGANIGFMLDLPLANASLTAPTIGLKGGGSGVADLYVEPFDLGWHLKRADIKTAYGFMAPTGRYTPGASDNIGSGYWGHLLTLSSTFYLDKVRSISFSSSGVYEIHQQREGTDATPGQTFTLEYGLGKLLPVGKQYLQVGVVGYGQWQVTDNGDAPDMLRGHHYRIAAIGPEMTLIIPKHKLSLTFRCEPEFAGRARVQGTTLVFAGGITF